MAYLVLVSLAGLLIVDVACEVARHRMERQRRAEEEASRAAVLRELRHHTPVRLTDNVWESIVVTPLRHARRHDN